MDVSAESTTDAVTTLTTTWTDLADNGFEKIEHRRMDSITQEHQLPPIGAPETVSLEFKKSYASARTPSFDGFELGKDVAALANAMGGTILVGAQEVASALHMYLPRDDGETKRTIRAIEEATRDRCSPSPVVSMERIPYGSGYVIAVNVSPFPSQAVGVWVRGDKGDGYGDPAWTFPVRVGTQTKFFRPEQLAMLMLPELRRIAIALSDITQGVDVILHPGSRTTYNSPYSVTFLSSDPLANVLTIKRGTPNGTVAQVAIPMDGVRSVWKDGNHWHIALKGQFAADSSFIWHD